MYAPQDLFNLDGLTHKALFQGINLVWEALDRIEEFTKQAVRQAGAQSKLLRRGGDTLAQTVVVCQDQIQESGFELLGGDPGKGKMKVRINGQELHDAAVIHAGAVFMTDEVHLAPGCLVEPGTLFKGPTFIGPNTEVRQGAYLRGGCLIGKACVVGHTTEVKNTAMLDGAKAGHFAYLGDSILGRDVNLGAGTKLANLKMNDRPIRFSQKEHTHEVRRKKFGAIMGDGVETGCNSVTNPGTILGPGCLVMPCISVKSGYYLNESFITNS